MLEAGHCPCLRKSKVEKDDVVMAGVTPLHVATAFGHVELVTALVDYTVAAQVDTFLPSE